LIATGIKPPGKNILLSIGSYKEKAELLPSVKKLHELGYKLFATAGTADFIQEHGIAVQFLEVLNEGDDEKSEYSLTQHLANNLIDLYINLPSSNRFRRPASYMSKGYRTRRMAVDYSIPLVTNVKCAKLLVEALALDVSMEVSSIDCQSSHRVISLPGLINVATFVPSLLSIGSDDFEKVSQQSLASGFSMIRVLPFGVDSAIVDSHTLLTAQENTSGKSFTDFNLSIAATDKNAGLLAKVTSSVGSLVIPFNYFSNNVDKVASVSEHFGVWPANKPIVTDATSTELASILLLASLHNRNVHITNVTRKADVNLIAMAKEKGLKVSCDVSIHALFLSLAEYPECQGLPSKEDQDALWENIAIIDIFAVGLLPSQLAKDLGNPVVAGVGISDALPLLLTAVREGRLTVDDVIARMHTNPKKIFELHDQPGTSIEVDLDRPTSVVSLVNKTLYGTVERVLFDGHTVSLEGAVTVAGKTGKDVSGLRLAPTVITVPPSPVVRGASALASPRPASPTLAQTRKLSFNVSSLVSPGFSTGELEGAAIIDEHPRLPKELSVPSALRRALKTSPFFRRHVISVKDFTRTDLHLLFSVAQELRLAVERVGVLDLLKGRVLATLFYEPSTRTSTSFDAAMQRLGGRVIPIATSTSSVLKGETLQDTVRTLASYTDIIVLRHPSEDSAHIAAKYSPVPIINGGNGSLEHPTQAFLDLFTIREELGTVNGLTVTFMGDLKYGRTVHSLCHLLKHYQVRIQLVCPQDLVLPKHLRDELVRSGKIMAESEQLTDEILANTDVLYCTRVQKERFPTVGDYERFKDIYVVDNNVLSKAKKHMCVMHPLPRVNEISEEVDFDNRAAYFRQVSFLIFEFLCYKSC
jgi:carbamoyl-phosphate synthase/aspartate carbamoyltransferase